MPEGIISLEIVLYHHTQAVSLTHLVIHILARAMLILQR